MLPPFTLEQTIDRTVREEWGRILASLVKSLGDFQLSEDCLQEAVISAMQHWQKNGLPKSPSAWLITVARRKAIDRIRQDKTFADKKDDLSYLLDLENQGLDESEPEVIADKRLEMIFTCCHPALEEKTRVALTLRTLCGLTTDEIASAFLDKFDAMQQRLTRAKKKIALAGIPYKVPEPEDLQERLSSVLRVIYLVFNEGYSASNGDALVRAELTEEAIRLARIVSHLLPDETEVSGLLALMLLHDSRRLTRADDDGDMIPLEHQNRQRWSKAKIAEGVALLEHVLPKRRLGPYQLQAAISAVHAQSASWQETNWQEIAALYDLLYSLEPSPVVRINQAIAVSYAVSAEKALEMLEAAGADGALENYQPFHAAKAELLIRSGKSELARSSLNHAIELSDNQREKSFLQKKLESLWTKM